MRGDRAREQVLNSYMYAQSSGAVWKSRWTSWAPVPNKPTVSVDVKQHFNNMYALSTVLFRLRFFKNFLNEFFLLRKI